MEAHVLRIGLGILYATTAGVFLVRKGSPSDERRAPLSALTLMEPGSPIDPELEDTAAVNMDDLILRV